LPDPKLIPQASDQYQPASICQLAAAVTQAKRPVRALNVRAGFDMMDSHRLGASCCEETSGKKSLQRKAPDGVLHLFQHTRSQDPGLSDAEFSGGVANICFNAEQVAQPDRPNRYA
jgi:hypothetical protein